MNDSSDALAELLTLTVTVNEHGTRIYRNPMGQLHRQYGPAIEWADGDKEWYLDGQHHRIDGPAIEYADGSKAWWLNGQALTARIHYGNQIPSGNPVQQCESQ